MEAYPHMVTGVPEEIRNRSHMVTGNQEEMPCCSPGNSSGKQKKARSTSRPQFRSENTPGTIEADQILLALQQLATNSNSANFNNNIDGVSKLPKSFTTTMPTIDGKSEKFDQFGHLFRTSLKIHSQLTQENKINYFHSLSCVVMYCKPLKTSPGPTERLWEKFSPCSVDNTWNLRQGLQRNTTFNDWSSIQQTRS